MNKMKYFDVKVVKVKKKKREWTPDRCPCCGAKREAEKPLNGNWINGENLDKIKFPVPCSHRCKGGVYSGYGMLIRDIDENVNRIYRLIDVGKQRDSVTTVSSNKSLKALIEQYDIHILKGKIIIFEEEE